MSGFSVYYGSFDMHQLKEWVSYQVCKLMALPDLDSRVASPQNVLFLDVEEPNTSEH